jgi:hypothetical protein
MGNLQRPALTDKDEQASTQLRPHLELFERHYIGLLPTSLNSS